jgi:hypothetical protein
VQKAAQVAGKAAPAVAVVGALAAVPHLHHHTPAAPASAGQMTPPHLSYSGRALTAHAELAMPVRNLTHQPRHARKTQTAAVRKPKAHPRSHSSISAPAHQASRQHSSSSHQGSSSRHQGSPSSSQHSSSSGQHSSDQATLTCSGSGTMLPLNYAAIVGFLTAHGYTGLAAAGIAGNIWQESRGNPESVGTGGGGLIGWTPLPAGFVTGNPSADLETQLDALLTYNEQWHQYIPTLNAATNATEASDIYMSYFERPGIPAASNREAAANAVAAACGL